MIVDAHAHYLSPRVIEELERDAPAYGCELRTTPDGLPQIVFPGRPPLRPVGRPVRDLSERITRIAQQGVDRQVLSTWMELYCYFLPPEIGARWCRLQNRTLAEDLRAAGGRFSGMAVVPLQDGKLAAAELEYAATQLGLRGVMVGPNFGERNLDDPSLEPLWAAAEALDQPVLIHPYAPQIGFRLARYNLSQAVGNPLDTTIAAGCLIFGGVADRHPALKVILAHGGGFFPYQVGRFQRVYQVSPEAREHASRPPLDYARWFYYDTVLLYAPAVRYLVETVGADRVLLGSDYPFDVGDPDPTAVVRAAGLAPAAEAAVLGGTCCQLFGLT
ncbi:MAG TPA: amidohydrolase family protein [Chloroflexota bacterium]|nr:amidohydrolase family protein [Chloroflexota bacterium]